MIILVCVVGKQPEVRDLPALDLATLRGLVHGDIEHLEVGHDGVGLYLNEEGRIQGLPLNRYIIDDRGFVWDILGDFVVVGPVDDEGNDTGLTPEQATEWAQRLRIEDQ